jgi:ERCC4-type nuclease
LPNALAPVPVPQSLTNGSRKNAAADFLVTPYVVVIDTREQHNYDFGGIVSDASTGRKPVLVQTRRAGLKSGDYSVDGFEDEVAVERKSAHDLFNTLGQDRKRFERELARLGAMRFAAVVVEAEWSEILNDPPPRSRLNPKTVFRSVVAWQQRWPAVHWWQCPGRAFAEVATFRMLERYWRENKGRRVR